MSFESRGASLWEHTAGADINAAPLQENVTADVVIIGGGFTGCSAALHLAEGGATVCLLEAKTIGFGGSGRNVGLVNAGLWLEPDKVEAFLGKAEGEKLNNTLAAGPSLVYSLIDKHEIQCELTRSGTLHVAHSNTGLANLRSRHEQLTRRGAPVELLDQKETAQKTGSDLFHGALLDHRAGTIQPLAYVRGLARAAIAVGARLYEHSAANAITRANCVWCVDTPTGSVSAKRLMLCTNAYHAGLKLKTQPQYTPVYYFQIATGPLEPDACDRILPERQGAWDTAMVMSSFRVDAQNRLVLGAIGSLDHAGRGVHHAWAGRRLRRLFPRIGDCPFDYAWSGRIAMTSDHLPKITNIDDHMLNIYGYSGRGIAPGTVFGKAAARYFLTGDESWLPMTQQRRLHNEKIKAVKQVYYELGASMIHLVNER